MRKENKNINPCHSREGGNPGQRYSFIITWIAQSSWAMTVCALTLLLSLSACGEKKDETATSSKPTIKIGVVLPLSGDLAIVGQSIKDSILLAKDDLKSKNLKNNYELVIDDDAFDAKRTISVFNKMKSIDKVDALISFASQGGGVVSPLAEQSQIIQINIGASEAKVAEGKYNFVHWTTPKETSKRMLEFYNSKGYKKIVAIITNNGGNYSLENAIKGHLEEYQEMSYKSFYVQPNEKDYRLLLEKVKAEKPDVILTLVYGNNAVPFVKQFFESNINVLLTNIETLSTLADFDGLDGIYYSDTAIADENYTERFTKKYPKDGHWGIGNAYDSLMLFVEAFEKAETKENAVKELQKIKSYNGMLGKLTQDESGVFNSEAVLKQIQNGKPIVVRE